ncbi:GNAT family N-acetyltransferase [uncultured Agrococcus sp.]|uniref:GNAT family N-acetyltransferase n=1 Tax=uncultured Agrococcus sp. TaxID=382258 RepID=UPI0025D82A3F|nr:GNAT family N-acetyltransferase [uncultured Agrococcus sp.]
MHSLADGTEIEIRRPTGDDALAWDEFVAREQGATYDALPDAFVADAIARARERADERRKQFDEPGTSVRRLATSGGEIVGVAEVGDGPPEWEVGLGVEGIGYARELVRLYLAPAAKGSGLATALLREVTNGEGLYLWILDGNDRAHRFYSKHGFIDVDERVTADDSWGGMTMHRMVRPSRLATARVG